MFEHAARFGKEWDKFLPGVQWVYRNTPHEATGEKPSYLLFGVDLRTPSEVALLPTTPLENRSLRDYREELVMSLTSARELAARSIQHSQKRYKKNYDRRATDKQFCLGDWVLVRFPHEESGAGRKLSRPWHGPFRVVACSGPDITVVKVYRPQDSRIQIHQLRVTPCPPEFPAGYFWYGNKRHGPGRPPKWVDQLLTQQVDVAEETLSAQEPGLLSSNASVEPEANVEKMESTMEGVEETEFRMGEHCDPARPDMQRTSQRFALRQGVKPPKWLHDHAWGQAY